MIRQNVNVWFFLNKRFLNSKYLLKLSLLSAKCKFYKPTLPLLAFKACSVKTKMMIFQQIGHDIYISSLLFKVTERIIFFFKHNYSQSFSGGILLPVLILTYGLPWRYNKEHNTWMGSPTLLWFLDSHYLMLPLNKEVDKSIYQ